ncbi:MAG: hypothetical protein JRI32_08745 [Deltaproteobacteria bacterium]|nr:hypothetical protein [Deltaproteobacteria bacterium]MBW2011707.1 hypothetical protein [Deltaproteobacteria bacterium]
MNLSDPHYNGSGIYCNVRVEIDNTRHRKWIRKPCHSKSTVHNIVFLPKAMIYHRRNGNVLQEFALLSFDHMSRVILFFFRNINPHMASRHPYWQGTICQHLNTLME